MILEKKQLTLQEVEKYLTEDDRLIKDYIKKFKKLNNEDVQKLKKEIISLKNPKIKEENIVKLIDFLPKEQEEVNKIFIDVSLTEEETNAITEIIKKY